MSLFAGDHDPRNVQAERDIYRLACIDKNARIAELTGQRDDLIRVLNGLLNEAHTASKGLHVDSEWSIIARAAIAAVEGAK